MSIKKSDQKKYKKAGIEIFIVLLDFLVFFVCWLLLSDYTILNGDRYKSYAGILITCFICFLFFNSIYDAYAIGRRKISENAYSLTLSCALTNIIFYFLDTLAFRWFRRPLYIIIATLIQTIVNFYLCKLLNTIYFKNYTPTNSLIIYKDDYDLEKIYSIPFFNNKYNVLNKIKNPKTFGSVANEFNKYETVFVVGVNAAIRNGIVKECVSRGIEIFVVPHVGDVIMAGGAYVEELPVPMIRVERSPLNPFYMFFKRAFDVVVALCATIIFSPFMLLTAIAIKLYDGGPVLYKQHRLTKDRKVFTILKFRSMKVDAEKDGVARLVAEKDDRITPIGKIIRAIRFDELPQVFNILKGDMSIVGPRPERPEIAEQYEELYPSFALRLQVKAGLTGYAQIYGKYNTEPIDKLKMDLYYINKMSFLYDIQLCFMTIKTLFMKESTAGIEAGKVIASKSRDSE